MFWLNLWYDFWTWGGGSPSTISLVRIVGPQAMLPTCVMVRGSLPGLTILAGRLPSVRNLEGNQ